MPSAVVYAVGYIAEAGILSGATAAAIGSFALNYGAGILLVGGLAMAQDQARKAKQQAKDQYNAAQVDRLANISSAIAPRELVLGRVRKAGAVFYRASTGQFSSEMYVAIAIAGHEIDAVEQIYLNDQPVTLDANGYVQSAPYTISERVTRSQFADGSGNVYLPANYIDGTAWDDSENGSTVNGLVVQTRPRALVSYQVWESASSVQIAIHRGEPGQVVDPWLRAAFAAAWSDDDVAQGVAYVVMRCAYSETAFPNGLPSLSAVVRGAKVLDPRTGLTVWTENPALLMRHVYQHPQFGKAIITAEEDARFIAAANACDTSTTYRVYGVAQAARPLFTAASVHPFGTAARSVLDDLAQAMGGSCAFAGGQFYLKSGTYSAPVMSLGEADLAVVVRDGTSSSQNPIKISVHKERASKFNTVKPTIWDAGQDYKQTALTPLTSTALKARDGAELVQEISYAAISYAPQAQHVAGIMMRDARDPLVVELTFKLRAYPLELFDTVTLTLARYGWVNKPFMVLSRTLTGQGTVALALKETSAAITTMDADFLAQGYASNTNLPKPWEVADVGTLLASSGTAELLAQADGTVVSRVRVTWPTPTDQAVIQAGQVEVQYRASDSAGAWSSVTVAGNETQAFLSDVQDGKVYVLRARFKTTLAVGGWSEQIGHLVVGKTAPPSDVAGLSIAIASTGLQVSWTPCPDSDYAETILKVGGSWETGTVVDRAAASARLLGWRAAGSLTVWAAHVDTSGNVSSAPKAASIVIAAPPPPDALAIEFGTANIEARWAAPMRSAQQQPLDRVELAWTAGFSSVIDGKKATTATFGWLPAGTHTLFARYVDVGGNPGAPAQAVLLVNPPAQPVMTATETQVNAVTLRWQDAKTSQPIRKYAIFYGDAGTAFEAAMLYGSAGADSRSDILFYRSAGDKVAYLQAEDVAGNLSAPRQIDMSITMPNDFVLASEYYEDWHPAELVNGTIQGGMGGQIILPSYVGRTWAQRLSDNGWTTAQQKVDAGYPLVIQPVPTSGKHLERRDLGKVISSAVVRATPTLQSSVAGAVVTVRIRGSMGSSDTTWQPWVVGESVVMADFQYLEVEFAVESDGKGFVVLDDIYVRVEISEVSESAVLALSASDAGGTEFVCQKAYLDVRTVQATPLGSSNIARLNCIVDDGVSPAKVYVQAWDTSNNRTSGTVSLTISGV